jgi:hypothetical protein
MAAPLMGTVAVFVAAAILPWEHTRKLTATLLGLDICYLAPSPQQSAGKYDFLSIADEEMRHGEVQKLGPGHTGHKLEPGIVTRQCIP